MSVRNRTFYWSLVIAWCAAVVFTSARHEFWRDEVRALSLAMEARSWSDLPGLLQNEGHPILWYALLWAGYVATGSTVILPVLSVLIAGAAVVIVTVYAPLPRWLKVLFVLGPPLYEYSVMARNYGISMLLLFVFAWWYPARRKHPMLLGAVLALACNTNVHSLVLVGPLMAFWAWETFVRDGVPLRSADAARLGAAAAMVAAGAAAALVTIWPTDQMGASDASGFTAAHVVRALLTTIGNPAAAFQGIAPSPPGPLWFVGSVVLIGATLGLIRRPAAFCAALAGLTALSVLSQVVYSSSYRHQALFVVFLVTLYWIVLASGETPEARVNVDRLARGGLYLGLSLQLAILVVSGGAKVYADVVHPLSASKAFGAWLRSHPEDGSAILIGEPDFALESVPYYAGNPIYIVREQRFGKVVRFVRSARPALSLGELLRVAWNVQVREKREVLIALGHLAEFEPGSQRAAGGGLVRYGFGRTFSWSAEDLSVWNRSTRPLQQFAGDVVGDERYTVYRLVAPPQ